MGRSKTGGGPGTNGYVVQPPVARPAPPAVCVDDLDLLDPPAGFYPDPVSVDQQEPNVLRVTLSGAAGDDEMVFRRDGDQVHVVSGDMSFPINDPAQYGDWGPQWARNFYDPDFILRGSH